MIVMKFGGSSVANREQIEKVLAIVRGRLERKPAVVSSAHKGMTDALINAAYAAAKGALDAQPVIERQRAIAASLGCPETLLAEFYREIEDLLRGIHLVKEVSPRSLDYIASFGERMSTRCIADFFARQGVKAKAYDIWDLGFITDATFGSARPLPGYERTMHTAYVDLVARDEVPIITGFVGKTENGEITTVGRNGSDLTATLVAAALGAEEVEIWSDTDGVMTADPSLVPGARNIPEMNLDEASELAYFGSRVLHPSTLLPAMKRNIPVRVLNTNRPEHHGTVIREDVAPNPRGATSVAYKEGQCILTIVSTRMFGTSGFLARVFDVIARHGVVIDVIATSEVSVSMTTDSLAGLNAAIKELEAFGKCAVLTDKTILCVVAQRMASTIGLGAKVLAAMAEAGVNVEMLSCASGSINLSMVIDDGDIRRAVPVLHQMLFERT